VKDDVEPVASSRAMIEALRKAGGRPRHTEYPDLGHNVFAWAYTEPALVEWLFAQKRPPGQGQRGALSDSAPGSALFASGAARHASANVLPSSYARLR